ncbi:hypothetical protein, partial [Geobacillus jurassicus]
RASLGGPDERREQKFATLVGDHFGMSPTNILLTRPILYFIGDRGNTWKTLRYYSFPPFSFFIHEIKKFFMHGE